MVLRKDLLSIGFYRLSPFYGSDGTLSYLIQKIEETVETDDTGKPKKEITGLRVITFPGPYNYDHTDDSLKVTKDFPFAAESLDAIVDYLNGLPRPEPQYKHGINY